MCITLILFSQVPWPRDYISRPRAVTTSQQLEDNAMFFRHLVPFILPPVELKQPSSTYPSRNDVSEIIPRLYISDLAFAENPVFLASFQITHILSTLPDSIFRPPPSILPNQPVRMQLNLEDSPFAELAAHLPHTTTFIREALTSNLEAKVLVHCAEGISRSVSVVAAYLMAEYGWSPNDAVEYIRTKRVVADPNFGFVQQLHEYARDSLSLSNPVASPVPPFSAPP